MAVGLHRKKTNSYSMYFEDVSKTCLERQLL